MPHKTFNNEYCQNCGRELLGPYCHYCGQQRITPTYYALKHVLIQAFHDVTDLDSKFIRTVRTLILEPGKLAVEFFRGRRQNYLSPIKLYMIFSVFYFIVFSFFPERNIFSAESIYYTEFTGTAEGFIERIIEKRQINKGELLEKFTTVVSYTLYLVVVVFAILFSLIFYNLRRYFTEHLIFSLHLMAFVFLMDIAFSPFYLYFDNIHFRILGILFVTCLYGVAAVKSFYRQSLFRSAALVFTFAALFWGAVMIIAFTTLYVLAITF